MWKKIQDRIAYERTFSARERWERLKENTAIFIAWHLLPARVRKWTVVRAHVNSTADDRHPGDVMAFELYK